MRDCGLSQRQTQHQCAPSLSSDGPRQYYALGAAAVRCAGVCSRQGVTVSDDDPRTTCGLGGPGQLVRRPIPDGSCRAAPVHETDRTLYLTVPPMSLRRVIGDSRH